MRAGPYLKFAVFFYVDHIFYLVFAMVTAGGIHYIPNKNNCLDALPLKVSGRVKKTPKYIGINLDFDLEFESGWGNGTPKFIV